MSTTWNTMRFAQALQSRTFASFWLGQTISSLGDGAFLTALAVAVYRLTGSSLVMGLFLMAQITPQLLLTLFAGVIVDRLPRRLVLLVADIGRALTVLLIALLAWLNLLQLWHLFLLAVLFGLCRSFFDPAYRAITPQLVPKEHFSSANALAGLSLQAGYLLGPVLGASFIALGNGSAYLAFAFDGLTFVISVCSLLSIRSLLSIIQEQAGQQASVFSPHYMLGEVRSGFRVILASHWLSLSLLAATFTLVAYFGCMSVALPKLVFAVYAGGPWLLATITTATALGSVVGVLLVGQFRLPRRAIIAFLSYVLAGLALLVFSLPVPHMLVPFVVAPAAFFVGFGMNVMETIWATLLYELVPGEMLGRVSSVDVLGSLSLSPFGYLLAGWASDRFGPPAVFLGAGLLVVLLNGAPLLLRDIRNLQ